MGVNTGGICFFNTRHIFWLAAMLLTSKISVRRVMTVQATYGFISKLGLNPFANPRRKPNTLVLVRAIGWFKGIG